jgi:L-seryl-tRNA(Ser) seleniumtransferase
MSDPRRHLPGVDVLLASDAFRELLDRFPRSRVVDAARRALEEARNRLRQAPDGEAAPSRDPREWVASVEARLRRKDRLSLRRVINATGVVLHTNLGRAPLSEAARTAMAAAGRGYTNLEFDLERGERGSRYAHCVDLLRELTGADDVLVVNNNAAAVVLGLNTMAAGRDVLVSRGELVEIGGGFRIPDMLSRSGARLREVGTTNRTRLEDYQEAAREKSAAAVLKVHRSNFRISGFTEEATLAELAAWAREEGLFLFHDLGSGLLADPKVLGLPSEPRAVDSLEVGVGAVAISGDKLLGGPQAGIILGQAEAVAAMRKNPLCRALRVDKITLAGLEATLRHYLDPEEALREVPALAMLVGSLEELEGRTRRLASGLPSDPFDVTVTEGKGVVGGGTFPGVELPAWTLRIKVSGLSAGQLASRLRSGDPPVVARVESEETVLDLRTVDPADDGLVLEALLGAVGGGQ